jgi:hypothetical protein
MNIPAEPEADSQSVTGRSFQTSTRIAFFIAGVGMAAWAPLIPFVQARVGDRA